MKDQLSRLVCSVLMLLFLGMLTFGQVAGERTSIMAPRTIPPNASPGAQPPTLAGAPDAVVRLEQFGDFSCPQCAVKNLIFRQIRSFYGNRISFIFRHFPLDIQGHEKSYDAAIAAEAAGFQGKFWAMQNLLFSNQKIWTATSEYRRLWRSYARKLRLDVKKWENDCAGLPARVRVDADKKRAQEIGVSSVPTLYLNGVEVPFEKFSLPELKMAIDAELAKSQLH